LLCGARGLIELTDEFLSSSHVVALTDADEPLYTTVEMLDVQDRIAPGSPKDSTTARTSSSDDHVDAALAKHPHLTDEQRRLVTEWCQRGHRFQAAIGRAGAGKTTTVAACADAWTAAGYRVVGAAVKGEATRTLAAATGIECETVAWYLAHTDPQSSRSTRGRSSSSTKPPRCPIATSTPSWTWPPRPGPASDSSATPPNTAPSPPAACSECCANATTHTPELTTTHRLQDPHDRAAAQALREGRIDEAFDELAAAGTPPRRRRRPHHVPPRPRPMVGRPPRRARPPDGRPAQQHPPPAQPPRPPPPPRQRRTRRRRDPASGDRSFAVGDRITARAPNRDLHVDGDRHAYVRNGALGTIVAVHHDRRDSENDTLTVDFDGIGHIDIPRTFFDLHRTPAGRPEVGIDHAYALTSYAVQGSTRDVSTSRVDATATRAETYVDITRGRHANHLYLTATADPLDGEALPRSHPHQPTSPSPNASTDPPVS
jgi:hypothetical protein